jgi:hypothetical protein
MNLHIWPSSRVAKGILLKQNLLPRLLACEFH